MTFHPLSFVIDGATLIAAAQGGALPRLAAGAARLILAPATVDVLVEAGVAEALLESAVGPLIEVVSLTETESAHAIRMEKEHRLPHDTAHALALAHREALDVDALMSDQRGISRLSEQPTVTLDFLLTEVGLSPDPDDAHDDAPPATTPGPLTLTLDTETAALLDTLVARGLAPDPATAVARAVRGLAAAVL